MENKKDIGKRSSIDISKSFLGGAKLAKKIEKEAPKRGKPLMPKIGKKSV